jgi:orotidine-5'-phosphate decarboxylase
MCLPVVFLAVMSEARAGSRREERTMNFLEKLLKAERQNRSLLCVGLDPEPERLPDELRALPMEKAVVRFCRTLIEATAPYVSAFKPNLAFFEVLGPPGMRALQEIVRAVPTHIPVIADAKRGDIGHTASRYAAAIFETYGCDAMTVNPYPGYDAVAPFLSYRERGVLLLCRTSNPGARDLQDLPVRGNDGQLRPLYEMVARLVQSWNEAGNCGLVVGATSPRELGVVRALCPTLPLLVPGIGAQGADLAASVSCAVDAYGERAIISVSRAVIYAGADADYAGAAARAARAFCEQINRARGFGA